MRGFKTTVVGFTEDLLCRDLNGCGTLVLDLSRCVSRREHVSSLFPYLGRSRVLSESTGCFFGIHDDVYIKCVKRRKKVEC